MSEKLSSDAAQGFAIAGATLLGMIVVNRLGKQVTRVWRNWRSNDKPETQPAK